MSLSSQNVLLEVGLNLLEFWSFLPSQKFLHLPLHDSETFLLLRTEIVRIVYKPVTVWDAAMHV